MSCTNVEVNRINDDMLALIDSTEWTVNAKVKSNTQKSVKTIVERTGAIRNTPLQKILKLKVGAKVMLTHNLDTCDSLTNGTFGEIVGFQFSKTDSISKVFVHFLDPDCGKQRRKKYTELGKMFPGKSVIPIEMIEFPYSVSKNPNSPRGSCTVLQFPLKLAFAATAHKIQGQTVRKPQSLVVDMRSIREAAQAYVILSRVQALSQLFIVESVCPDKIYSSTLALGELDRMKHANINSMPSNDSIISCNIRSIVSHFEDVVSSSYIKNTNVICLQETWIEPDRISDDNVDIPGMMKKFTSFGKGKGIGTY